MVKVMKFRFVPDKKSEFKPKTIFAEIDDLMRMLAQAKPDGIVTKWEAQRLIKKAKEQEVIASKRNSDALLEDYLRQTMKSGIVVPERGAR